MPVTLSLVIIRARFPYFDGDEAHRRDGSSTRPLSLFCFHYLCFFPSWPGRRSARRYSKNPSGVALHRPSTGDWPGFRANEAAMGGRARMTGCRPGRRHAIRPGELTFVFN